MPNWNQFRTGRNASKVYYTKKELVEIEETRVNNPPLRLKYHWRKPVSVKEMFAKEKIDMNFLETKMDDKSEYWGKALKFMNDNWEKDTKLLSEKQMKWAKGILSDCIEKKIEG